MSDIMDRPTRSRNIYLEDRFLLIMSLNIITMYRYVSRLALAFSCSCVKINLMERMGLVVGLSSGTLPTKVCNFFLEFFQ